MGVLALAVLWSAVCLEAGCLLSLGLSPPSSGKLDFAFFPRRHESRYKPLGSLPLCAHWASPVVLVGTVPPPAPLPPPPCGISRGLTRL